jgi:hypothetical protein
MGCTSTSFNAFPYRGGHTPPSSPSLGGAHRHSTKPNTHHSSFGVGSQGLPSHRMPVDSTPFSLFDVFGNNTFSSAAFPTRGNIDYGQPNPMDGTIPAHGANPGIPSAQGLWNFW